MDPRMQQQPRFVEVITQNGPMFFDRVTGQHLFPQQLQQMLQSQSQMSPRFGNFNAGFQQPYPTGMTPMFNQQPPAGPRLTGSQVFDPNQTFSVPDNRYGDPGRDVTIVQQPQPEKADMRVTTNPSSVKQTEKPKSPPKTKLLSTPANLSKFTVRQHPFTETEVVQVDMNVDGYGFSAVLSQLYDQSVAPDIELRKTLIVGHCRLQEPYYQTSMEGMEESIFAPDVEDVYRKMHDIIGGAITRGDIVFFTEYNRWLTDHVNDWLKVLDHKNTKIDSFYDDFNDLKKHLGDRVTDNPELGTIYAELCKNLRNALLVCRDKPNTKSEEVENPTCIRLTDMIHIAYTKLLSIELWKDGIPDEGRLGNRLVSSMLPHVDNSIFYICTADKVIYKVISTVKYEVLVTRIEG
jgi:hypothetical protein